MFDFGAFGQQGAGFLDHLQCLFGVASALDDAGKREVFGDGLLFVPEPFVDLCEARVGDGVLRVDAGDMYPVFEGFVGVALFQVEIARADGGIHCSFEITDALGELRHLLGGDRVLGRDFGCTQVDLQRLVYVTGLEQGKPQTAERFGMVGEFLKGTAIRLDGFVPFLIPGGGMSLVHCFLKDVVSTGHSVINFTFG